MSSRLAEFDTKVATITHRREPDYGDPLINFDRIARLKAVVAECPDPRVRHVLEMICVKVSRLIQSPEHLDSWIDVAGYARTGIMVTEPQDSKAHADQA